MSVNEQMLEKIMERIDERLLASHQSKDAEISGLHREILNKLSSFETFMKRVEPMLAEYEDEKARNKSIIKLGKSIVFASAVIGSLGVIGSSLAYLIKRLI